MKNLYVYEGGPYGFSLENFKKICYNKRGIIIKALPQIKRTASYEAAPIYVILCQREVCLSLLLGSNYLTSVLQLLHQSRYSLT